MPPQSITKSMPCACLSQHGRIAAACSVTGSVTAQAFYSRHKPATDGKPQFQKPPNRILLKPIDRHFHTRRRSYGIARGSNPSFSVVTANAANANVAIVQGRLSDLYGWEDCRGNSNYSVVIAVKGFSWRFQHL